MADDFNILDTGSSLPALIGVADLEIKLGAPEVGAINGVAAWLMDDSSTEELAVYWKATFTGNIKVTLLSAPTTTATDVYRVRLDHGTFTPTDGDTLSRTLGTAVDVTAPGTTGQEVSTVVNASLAVTKGDAIVLQVSRIGGNANDTFTGDIGFLALYIEEV